MIYCPNSSITFCGVINLVSLGVGDLIPFSKARFTEEDFTVADKIFCWGSHDYTTLNSLFNNSKDKLVLSGSHRFDMMKEEFNDYWNFNDRKNKQITHQHLLQF